MNNSEYSFKVLLNKLLKLHESKFNAMEKILSNKANLLLENLFIISIGIYACADGIRLLANDYNIVPGNILLRSIFEGLVNIKYIAQDETQLRTVAFVLRDSKIKERLANNILIDLEHEASLSLETPYDSIENCKKRITSIKKEKDKSINTFKKIYKIDIDENNLEPWEEDMFKKAKEVDLFHDYTFIYRALCNYSHLDSTGLKKFFEINENGDEIKIKKDDNESETMLGGVCSYYFKAIIVVFEKFKIHNDKEIKPLLNFFPILDMKYSKN